MRHRIPIAALVLLLLVPGAATGQQLAGEWAWKPVLEQDGIRVRYIFYARADNVNDGVVLRVDNRNDHAVRYAFTAVFRSGRRETSTRVSGVVGARSTVTGDEAGLFFIPFPDGAGVSELGLRGWSMTPEPLR